MCILSGGSGEGSAMIGQVSCWRAAGLSGRPSQQASGLGLGRQQTLRQMSSRRLRRQVKPAPSE